ncbi:MAG: hypothetical protein ACE5PV_13945 [Candidatus Poribacteria bacterium]
MDIEKDIGWREYSGDAKLAYQLADNQKVILFQQLTVGRFS